jgi:hypothetical protein
LELRHRQSCMCSSSTRIVQSSNLRHKSVERRPHPKSHVSWLSSVVVVHAAPTGSMSMLTRHWHSSLKQPVFRATTQPRCACAPRVSLVHAVTIDKYNWAPSHTAHILVSFVFKKRDKGSDFIKLEILQLWSLLGNWAKKTYTLETSDLPNSWGYSWINFRMENSVSWQGKHSWRVEDVLMNVAHFANFLMIRENNGRMGFGSQVCCLFQDD